MAMVDSGTHDETLSEIDLLGQTTRNGQARAQALQVLQQLAPATTSIIEYKSGGRLVIIGPFAQALPIAEKLLQQLPGVAIVDPQGKAKSPQMDDRIFYQCAEVDHISGHLGDFHIHLSVQGKQTLPLHALLPRNWSAIDLVLDLLPTPCFDAQISPPGYFATRADPAKLVEFLPLIPDLIGEFEKPRYFQYDPGICAHGRNHKTACTRCIDACPTLAIRSLGEQIQVDPYLCQGGGTCAATCPSGAIQYVFPALADMLGRLRQLLKTYRQAGGQAARVLFYPTALSATVYPQLENFPEDLIPLALDEVGVIDQAILLNTLCYGAQQVLVLCDPEMPLRVQRCLQEQFALTKTFLEGMGYTPQRIVMTDLNGLAKVERVKGSPLSPASYASFSDKRNMIRLALEHLYAHATQQPATLSLSAPAPFGEITVDQASCTLCLACIGVCPTKALLAGNEQPQLNFIEDLCVQCGLCEQTCPESAIQRRPRYLFDSSRRRGRRELYSEEPFLCIRCNKPFASRRVIERMQHKLAGHWMFDSERAVRRLQMCEDCRVQDMWDEKNT